MRHQVKIHLSADTTKPREICLKPVLSVKVGHHSGGMVMKKICKTCKYWKRHEGTQSGQCMRCNEMYLYFSRPDTGEDFSCIHYSYRKGYLANLLKLDPSENNESAD